MSSLRTRIQTKRAEKKKTERQTWIITSLSFSFWLEGVGAEWARQRFEEEKLKRQRPLWLRHARLHPELKSYFGKKTPYNIGWLFYRIVDFDLEQSRSIKTFPFITIQQAEIEYISPATSSSFSVHNVFGGKEDLFNNARFSFHLQAFEHQHIIHVF